MDVFTIISVAVGIITAVLGGVWFILQHAFKLGELSNRFSSMETALKSIPCAEHEKILGSHEFKAESMDKTLADIKTRLADLPCKEHRDGLMEHARKVEDADKTLAGIGKTLADITSQLLALPCKERSEELKEHASRMDSNSSIVAELSKWVMKIDETMIDKLMQKCSPLKMTPAGEQLFAMSGADKALEALAPRLMEQMSETELRTEYDVEGKALEVLLQNTSDPAFDSVKNFVYASPDTFTPEGGDEPVKFSFYSIVHLMGVRLRDMYLESHPVAPFPAATD